MKKKKILLVCAYLQKGETLDQITTMANIIANVKAPSATISPQDHTQAPTNNVASSSSSNSGDAPIRLSVNDFPKFSGSIEKQDKYKDTVDSIVGQTAFKFLMERDAATANEKERDSELHYVFMRFFMGGKAYHLITQAAKSDDSKSDVPKSGRRVWEKFQDWCMAGGRKKTLIKTIKVKLKALKLNGDVTDGNEYVNQLIQYRQNLTDQGDNTSLHEILNIFVDNIVDSDFDFQKQTLKKTLMDFDKGQIADLKPQDFYDMVETRQRDLLDQADETMEI